METRIVGNGRQLSNVNAVRVAEVFRGIRKTGALTPARVLAAARRPGSFLRQFFEWDDSKAAAAHRLTQARDLIRAVQVRVVRDPDDAPRDVRCFVRLEETSSGPSYEEMIPTLATKSGRAQVLAQALEELSRVEKKYSDLKELSAVFEALSKVRRKRAA